jgi:DNA gyrase/topoisomerase IV subunit A
MGIRAANCTPKTGDIIGMHITYSDQGDVVLASRKGQFIRMELMKIKRLGRDTQGVTLMKLKESDKVSSVALILAEGEKKDNQAVMNLEEDSKKKPGLAPKSTHDLFLENAEPKQPVKKDKAATIKAQEPVVEAIEEDVEAVIPEIHVHNYKDDE